MFDFGLHRGALCCSLLFPCLSLAQDVPSSPNDPSTLRKLVTFVEVAVTVKDRAGRRLEGLSAKDFTVYEDRVPQKLSYFSSDPLPLSAAVVIDTNLPLDAMKAVHQSLPALVAAFSTFDEIAFYTYGSRVEQIFGFTLTDDVSLVPLKGLGEASPQEDHVLNDALLLAAQELGRRERGTRRRIVLVISNGREIGSSARYDEVRKELLSNDVAVYALVLGSAPEAVYDKESHLTGLKVPGRALSQLASGTGGDFLMQSASNAIADAYARITETARNQYTLGYNAPAFASSYRTLEVRVHRPGLVVIAKPGYYPTQYK